MQIGGFFEDGAGEETRTLDVHLGKVVLYQLSYSREREAEYSTPVLSVNQNIRSLFSSRVEEFPASPLPGALLM